MPRTRENPHSELVAALEASVELDEKVLTAYARLWQLETWLRRMAYVELRAKYGDNWDSQLRDRSAEHARSSDKALTHMASTEETDISYISFGKLIKYLSVNRVGD